MPRSPNSPCRTFLSTEPWHAACTRRLLTMALPCTNVALLRSLRTVLTAAAFMLSVTAAAAPASPAPAPSKDAVAGAPADKAKDDKAKDEKAKEDEKVAPDSPRAAIAEFRHLTRAGDYAGAARYLDLSQVDATDGPTLAAHLREVLNRHLWLDLDKVSAGSRGNTEDGQPADREELGTVPGASGKPEPVVLVGKCYRPNTHWVFSAATVVLIDSWYSHLENVWLMDHLPKPLLKMGPHLLRWWQWLALVPLLLVAWLVGYAVTRVARAMITRTFSPEHARAACINRRRTSCAVGWPRCSWWQCSGRSGRASSCRGIA